MGWGVGVVHDTAKAKRKAAAPGAVPVSNVLGPSTVLPRKGGGGLCIE